ncbi:MAG: riboflavin kinase [Candidatus Peribacteraceae bacterium]|nr:riboflavin kinase [Candidatus Peribacteraceae bacterium]MDD5742455.1 riboflavin kinase [Candidatus Peribacteraceae bacterium]
MSLRTPRFPLCFTARVVRGVGRGRTIGSPTLNLDPEEIPRTLKNGIYVCRIRWSRLTFAAAMHCGPRPVFADTFACEVHVIDHPVRRAPTRVTVEVVRRLRNIRNFRSVAQLQKQIARDIEMVRKILKKG